MSRFHAHTPLEPVTSARGRSVIRTDHDGPVFRGGGSSNYVCPHCGHLIAESVAEASIFDLVIDCHACHSLCEFDRLPAGATAANYVFVAARSYQLGQTVDLPKAMLIIGDGAITGGGTPLWN